MIKVNKWICKRNWQFEILPADTGNGTHCDEPRTPVKVKVQGGVSVDSLFVQLTTAAESIQSCSRRHNVHNLCLLPLPSRHCPTAHLHITYAKVWPPFSVIWLIAVPHLFSLLFFPRNSGNFDLFQLIEFVKSIFKIQ